MEEKSHSLIHCITNPISMNQTANTILALGAKPIMAEHPDEVMEITRTASSLLLNMGNITETRITSMRLSLKEANDRGIPVTLDAVGVACSTLRKNLARVLMTTGKFTVIKGNCSEILALYDDTYRSEGVDAKADIDITLVKEASAALAQKTGAFILATGKTDIIADHGNITEVTGGCAQLSEVTGTGCMLGAVIAVFLTSDNSSGSVAKACGFFKACGVKAATDKGIGSFMVNLLDALGEKNGI